MKFVFAAALVISVALGPQAFAQMSQSEVEEALTCQCGCGLTVHSCNHTTCSFAIPVRAEIAEALAAGQSGEEIIASYMEKYGEKILSSPTLEGFNLLAWYTPYFALLVGAVLIVVVIRRWARPHVDASAPTTTGLTKNQRDTIDKALEEL